MPLFLSLFYSNRACSTHIVGGDFYYELLNPSENLYKLTLIIYVDCINGSNEAISSDAIANIGEYDAINYNLISTFQMWRGAPQRLDDVNYECVIPPSTACVDKYTYVINRVIDPGNNGKILGFQRCCRNNTINNIIIPDATGATYWMKIPPANINNSSAVFNNLPPNFVCINAPLTVDHSASDPDGDSLVYSLVQPYRGASTDNPRPVPPQGPPYYQVIWSTPYSTNNQMGGSPRLSINSKTGELTVTPDKTGQYVIGISVKEYRSGTLINETLRDYQMNVEDCQFNILANFATTSNTSEENVFVFECSDTVQFLDRSLKATYYSWDFGDPERLDDTSNLKNPFYIYPGNGDYTVILKVKNEICEDEHEILVRIRSKKTFELGPDKVYCELHDVLLNTQTPDATSVLWNNGMTGSQIRVRNEGTYIATVSYNQCVYSDTVALHTDPVMLDIPDDHLFCNKDEVDILLDVGIDGLRYRWNTGPTDTFQTLQVNTPGNYIVRVYNKNNCSGSDTIRIWVASQPEIPDAFYCNDFIHIVDAGLIEEATYLWSNGAQSQQAEFNTGGKHWLRIMQRHCIKSDSFTIYNSLVLIDLGEDRHYCDVIDENLDAGPKKTRYYWNTGDTDRIIHVNTPGKFWVEAEDENGCTNSDTILLSLSNAPGIFIGNDTSICLRTPIVIGPQKEYAAYEWNTGEDSRFISTETEGLHILKVYDEFGCSGRDSLFVTVDETALPNELYIPNAFTPDGNQRNDLFPFSKNIPQPGYYVMIFSRWGEKVFDSRSQEEQNWDGNYKGQTVHNQTFIYYIEYRGCDGITRVRKGTVNPLY